MEKSTRELRKENNRLDGLIKEENQAVFTDIVCYLRGSKLSEHDVEVVRFDLTSMVLEAQERGENIESLFGKCRGCKEFCDEIIDSLPKKTKFQAACEFFSTFFLACAVSLLIGIIFSAGFLGKIIKGKLPNASIEISIGEGIVIILIVVIAYVLVKLVMRSAFESETIFFKISTIAVSTVASAVLIFLPLLLRDTLFTLNLFVGIAIVVFMFIASKTLERFV